MNTYSYYCPYNETTYHADAVNPDHARQIFLAVLRRAIPGHTVHISLDEIRLVRAAPRVIKPEETGPLATDAQARKHIAWIKKRLAQEAKQELRQFIVGTSYKHRVF